jgi:hypothetical protein
VPVALKLAGPVRYHVSIVPGSDGKLFQIKDGDGKPKFSKPATSNLPKLYIVTVEGHKAPIYVGITKQSMRTRLRLGCTADGRTGYHGYAWRHVHPEVALDLWCNTDPDAQKSWRDIETVEGEIVFLIRQMGGQWPSNQTEIHFRPSEPYQREAAETIVNRYLSPR